MHIHFREKLESRHMKNRTLESLTLKEFRSEEMQPLHDMAKIFGLSLFDYIDKYLSFYNTVLDLEENLILFTKGFPAALDY